MRSRKVLTDAAERLLREGRVDFSIPELASVAGVGVATAYRHFPSPSDALHACYARSVGELVDSFSDIDPALESVLRFETHCQRWVIQAQRWGPAVRHIRSHEGFIERLNGQDPSIVALYTALDAVLQGLADFGRIVPTDRKVAALLWITIFDERVIYDLEHHHGWTGEQIIEHLTMAARGALRIT